MPLPVLTVGWRKTLLVLVGLFICLYAFAVLWYVQSIPDVGIRCAFDPTIKYVHRPFLRAGADSAAVPTAGDRIVQLGDRPVETWPQLLQALIALRGQAPAPVEQLEEAEREHLTHVRWQDENLVRVVFERPGEGAEPGRTYTAWCLVGRLPVEEFLPSVAWFFLKLGLFLVGALVFWKRPTDAAARQFFLLCVVTLGAYMGGYHWSRIATQPTLLVVFMLCAVFLPVILLHFYIVFPRPKEILQRHPRWTLLAVYGLPMAFLATLGGIYGIVFLLARGYVSGNVDRMLAVLLYTIYAYLGVAALWYLASIACLIHSYRRAADTTERNQVKWILFGSLGALVPIGYSLYIAVLEGNDFAAGAATWPMFAASVCFTAAFTISITRYRLMQLDQLISSGMVYFLISCLAALVYYAVALAGVLIVGTTVVAWPQLPQALGVSLTALVLLVVLDLARSRLKKALDRRFYREKHQLDRTLRRMGQAVEQLVDPPTLARRLLQASADLLGVPRGAVYLREGDPPLYRLAGCLGPAPPVAELPPGSPLLEVLATRGALVASFASEAAGDPAGRQLRHLGGEVAHALANEGQLLAVLVLGPKDLGTYGQDDLNLLSAFAQLTALALENAERHQTIEVLNGELRAKVEKISEQQRRILALQSQLRRETVSQRAAASVKEPPLPVGDHGLRTTEGIVGSSTAVQRLLHLVRKVSASPSAVLLRGESGTGKELLARALHANSPRTGKAFVKVHCAALSPGLLESELFGHVKGAFTGAHRDKVGRFELADGGTLFLDEIGDISLEVQTKLLRVLQEMTFERVGSSEPVTVDVRVIAATHQDLEQLIRAGRFREDLYYRLNVISLHVPPLRERREDIPELAAHFLKLYAQRSGRPVPQLDDDVLAVLKAHAWPGNIRELENVLERAVVVVEGPVVTVQDLPPEILRAVADHGCELVPLPDEGGDGVLRPEHEEQQERDRRERERLERAIAAAAGNKAEAARALGMARSTLISRMKKYGLN